MDSSAVSYRMHNRKLSLQRGRARLFLLLLSALLLRPAFCTDYVEPPVHIPPSEVCAATELRSPFALDYYWDIPLALTSVSLTISGMILEYRVDGWDGDGTFKKRDINSFDAIWYNPYRPAIDHLGTMSAAVGVVGLPLGVYLTEAIVQNLPVRELGTVGMMLGESYLMAYGIRNIIKTHVRKTRPYMYTYKWDKDGVRDGDYSLSFPSGHTTDAFLGAAFLSYTFCKYYPDSKLRFPVVATSYALAITTGALRVASGNHFLSDVAGGAVLGTAVGFLIPVIHQKIAAIKYKGRQVLEFDGQSLTATINF